MIDSYSMTTLQVTCLDHLPVDGANAAKVLEFLFKEDSSGALDVPGLPYAAEVKKGLSNFKLLRRGDYSMFTEGSVFHVETYGLNAMGSHANQLSVEERWMVAAYVMKLKSEL